jgi:hypothetical protein
VFVDECGTHVSLAPIYGYSLRVSAYALRCREPWQEHDFTGEYEHQGDGAMPGD